MLGEIFYEAKWCVPKYIKKKGNQCILNKVSSKTRSPELTHFGYCVVGVTRAAISVTVGRL